MRRAASAPLPPELPSDLDAGAIGSLSAEETYDEIELANAVLADQRAGGVAFRNARWTKLDVSGSQLEQLSLEHCQISGCNLANVQARHASLARVNIQSSRLTGMHLPESALRDLTIQGSRVDLASFSFSRLVRVTFDDCLLAQTDFLQTQLESVRFHGCDLTRADFRGAQLRSCEFRHSDLTGLEGVQSLRGAAMEWPDIIQMAGVWAAALGIEVLDDD